MHDLACSVRPVPNGARLPSAGPGAPVLDRGDPFPVLVADWTEILAFDLTVNATSEEGIASKLISGPFRIDELAFRSGSAGGVSQQLRVSVGDTFPAAQAVMGSDSGLPTAQATDSSRSVGTFYATTVYERHIIRFVSQTGTARIQWILNNTTGAGVTVLGHVVITHLRPGIGLALAPQT